jgi:CSLREA domain-containing protein
MQHRHLLPLLLPLFMFAACTEDQPPTAPAEPGGMAEGHTAGHKVVNSLADPGNGPCNATQCTLREAIKDPGSTEISFAPGLTGTITLAAPAAGGGTLSIDKKLSITGPSTGIVIRRRSTDPDFRIFRIPAAGNVTLTNLTIQNGKRTDRPGAGILNFGTLRLTNSTVASNSGSGIGNVGTLRLTNSTVAGNSAGGIGNFGTLTVTLTNSTVAGNSAADGGGIHNSSDGSVTITNSTIAGNSASDAGGGIFNEGRVRHIAFVTLTNSAVSGNTARFGGGIFNSSSSEFPVTTGLTNSTVADNSATVRGGGISTGFGGTDFLSLRNSLVARNSAPEAPDVFISHSGNASVAFSLIGDGSGSGITNTDGNQVGNVPPNSAPIDPGLGPLADNGGPTQTHALLLGSPALDAASTPDCPTTDQRGVLRPQGAACDIGSYERAGQ